MYNGDGVRTRQVVSGTTTDYVQDLGAPLPVVLVEKESGQSAYYLYGLDLVGQEQTAWQYYHYDGLGSVRHLTNASGQTIARYDYYAFGAVRAASGTAQGGDEWQFTGEQWDGAAELYFLRARYYDPGVGRFVSADPFPGYAWLPQSLNGYCYVGNDPVNYRDPGGLWPERLGAEVLCRECRDDIPAECMDASCNIIVPIGNEANVNYFQEMYFRNYTRNFTDEEYFRQEDPVMLLARLMYGEAADATGTELQQRMSLENVGWIAKIRYEIVAPHISSWKSWHDVILGSGPGDTPFHGIHEDLTGEDIYRNLKNPWGSGGAEGARWKWCAAYKMARRIYEASPADIPWQFLVDELDSFCEVSKWSTLTSEEREKYYPSYHRFSRWGIRDEEHVFGTTYEIWPYWRNSVPSQ